QRNAGARRRGSGGRPGRPTRAPCVRGGHRRSPYGLAGCDRAMTETEALLEGLESTVRSYGAGRAVVALSGGVDSSVVTAVAAHALGAGRVLAVTAVSPSYPAGELHAAQDVAALLKVPHRTITTAEVDREAYARNDGLRCYHCKVELYTSL